MKSKGFTLIELIVVIGIMSVLTAVGLANYGAFIKKQAVQEEGKNFVSILRKAQSDASSGNAMSFCPSPTDSSDSALLGYDVEWISSSSYKVSVHCTNGNSKEQNSYSLDNRVKFDSFFSLTFLSPLGDISSDTYVRLVHSQDNCVDNAVVTITAGGGINVERQSAGC